MRYGMMIELDKCVGCQACVSACKERWDSGPGAARDWVMAFNHGSREDGTLGVTFYPGLCNHCDDHPCTADCPTGATYQTEEGVVVVDPEVCIGCGNCVPNCPYGARHADPAKGIVEKCNFCAPYVAQGQQPACVTTCLAECRHFGDLDDPKSDLNQRIKARGAATLTTNAIDIGPRIYYAPEKERMQVLAQGVVHRYDSTLFTKTWQRVTRPVAQWAIAPMIVGTALAGLVINLRNRHTDEPQTKRTEAVQEDTSGAIEDAPSDLVEKSHQEKSEMMVRHHAGMRFLHWFNLLSWILLLGSGTALIATSSFALFGTSFPQSVISVFGGKANLIWFHVVWGLLWAIIILPLFLYYKRGGIDALKEIRPTYDDLDWMIKKPLVMVGLLHKDRLPPQDKYNAGQKGFAISALFGTAIIILTGLIMTFHIGPAELVRTAILAHKLAVMLALVGIAVHITMAAIVAEERPALWSMIVGQIDARHARSHNAKWAQSKETGEEA